jgi:hypothetical protein
VIAYICKHCKYTVYYDPCSTRRGAAFAALQERQQDGNGDDLRRIAGVIGRNLSVQDDYDEMSINMSKRKELESGLAKAEAAREYLEAALARAEAALIDSVADGSRLDANRAEAAADVDRARARCRRLRAALVQLDASASRASLREWSSSQVMQSREGFKPDAPASPSSIPSTAPAVCSESKNSQREPSQGKTIHRADTGSAARETEPRDVCARSALLRQTIDLSALILAYLAYFHVDVQLQILNLPSIIP